MDGCYDIFLGGEKIGKAEVRQRGLYYQFRCWCDLTGHVICRIKVRCGAVVENLGVPIPSGDAFCLIKRLPVSRFPEAKPHFFLEPKHPPVEEIWVAVKPDEPFGYLKEIKNAVLEIRDGVMGLRIRLTAPALPGSDPSP